MSAHAPQICDSSDSSENRSRMLHFNRQIHTCYHNTFLLLNKICDGGSSKEPFLKAATLSILSWAYPAKRKQTMAILKMPPFRRVRLHAHSFCRCVPIELMHEGHAQLHLVHDQAQSRSQSPRYKGSECSAKKIGSGKSTFRQKNK